MSDGRFSRYIEAYDAGGLHELNLAYLRAEFGRDAPIDQTSTPRALLEWLRTPSVNSRIDWPQDHIVAFDRAEPDGIDWIAMENQFLWAVTIRDGDESDDPIVEVVNPEDGPTPQRLIGRMTVSELTSRLLYREHDWTGTMHDPSSHGVERLGIARRVLEPIILGHQLRAGWGGLGLGPYWYCSFSFHSIRIHTDDPERIAAEFADHEHLTWEPR